MARRRTRDDRWIILVAKLGAFAFLLLFLLLPDTAHTTSTITALFNLIAVCLLGVLGIGLVGLISLAIYRWSNTPERLSGEPPAPESSDHAVEPVPSGSRPDPPPGTQSFEPQRANPSAVRNSGQPIGTPRPQPAGAPDLLEQLRSIDWFQFEELVALLYRKLGCSVTRSGGAKPDGGIDLVIEKDGERFAVQCKQWRTWNVGVKAVREFLGALTDAGIQKGIFITLCGYTGEAKLLADKHGIEIVNETGLARMLDSTDARFDPETLAILQDTRKYCPKCESEMVLRTASKGLGAGKQFWGCSTYPRCRFTMPKE